MAAKRPRATQEEKEERIQMVLECLLFTDSPTTVIQSIMAQFGVEKRMAFTYLKEARQRLASLLEVNITSHLGLTLSRTNHLYAQCLQQDGSDPRHTRNALDALRLAKDVVLENAKHQLHQKGGKDDDDTLARNPLLARILNGHPAA